MGHRFPSGYLAGGRKEIVVLLAKSMFDRIGDGHRNAVKRPDNENVDRQLRALNENANHNGDCIISGDSGYYRPVPGDVVDDYEYRTYMAKDRSRIKSLEEKQMCMIIAFESRKKQML